MPAFFALDLDDSPHARIKFYMTVAEQSTSELQARADHLSSVAGRTAADFIDSLSTHGSTALAGPGVRPTLCWSMTSHDRLRPDDATLYLPFNRYTPDGQEALGRLRKILEPAHFHRIERLVAQRTGDGAPSEPVNPFLWAGTKLNRGGKVLTLYVSADVVDSASRTAQ